MDVDQLKVAGEVGGWVLSGNDVPLQRSVPGVPQGAADVQAASFGREIPRKRYDVLWRDREGRERLKKKTDKMMCWKKLCIQVRSILLDPQSN